MKTHLLFIVLVALFVKAYGQDTTKTQIIFLTKDNQQVPLYQEIYVGDFHGQGYDSNGITYQHGVITRKEFLFNTPGPGYFEKNKQIDLVAGVGKYCNVKFTVDTRISNQKWLLTPVGKGYYKGLGNTLGGVIGIVLSSVAFATIGTVNYFQMDNYKNKMDQYNFAKKAGFQEISVPQKPKSLGAWYLIPTCTMSFSIISLVRGRIINSKNRPSVIRIQ